jgi:hypothetical protein
MRPTDSYHAVSESLQADVMRFMAIIAFCLIAILALVRSVEPATDPRRSDLPVATSAPAPELSQRTLVTTAPATPSPAAPPPAAPTPLAAAPATPAPAAAVPAPDPATVRSPERPAKPILPAPPAAQQGLTLRFASDQDFLRLVGRGRVQVYAFDAGRVLRLGEDFRFMPAGTPGRVHELLPDTIPALMRDALRVAGDTAGYHWGIAMPERMARQVRDFVDRGVSGELVIDRYGEVRLHDDA